MLFRFLVPLLFVIATFLGRARRVKEEATPIHQAPDPHSKFAYHSSTSRIAGHFTKPLKRIQRSLSASKSGPQSANVARDVLGNRTVHEEGRGAEGEQENPEKSFFLVVWNALAALSRPFFNSVSAPPNQKVSASPGDGTKSRRRKVTNIMVLGSILGSSGIALRSFWTPNGGPAGDESVRTGASTSKIAEYLTKPFKRVEKRLKDPASLHINDLFRVLHDISKQGGGLEEVGFANVATELLPNVMKFSACPGDQSVVRCLKDETVRLTRPSTWQYRYRKRSKDTDILAHTLARHNKPAVLEDPSPAMGIIWSIRILGFMEKMADEMARGKSLVVAANSAYVCRIAPAFASWSPLGMIVKSAILSGLSETDFMAQVGGEEAGMDKISENVRADMKEFSKVVLPLVDKIWEMIVAYKLDDSPIK